MNRKNRKCKCDCHLTKYQCCDICTGWSAYVKKHGHPPKDKNRKKERKFKDKHEYLKQIL